ncbi:TPA: hypothetical protein PXF07_000042 [Mannheimia haemolytica]|uniref:Uncharacterized protein n=1 Tax=Mannheimia haemolytica TaxID=75985 RepID=A0A378MVI2_MANHA|nr:MULTISPECIES: hypothetical protein [Mannheimia]AGK01605.1 hypothetical protein MHH_c11520 [Mannheimia haemolytica M42548]AGQ26425.1 hypothetical protein F382_10885 [Mannheimia haemolytica D153]AGR74363.1 hypothetical protein N220_02990 [Mannheimia haemolytica USMARC_2286]EDN74900.1 hypothetical protein MHA_2001 [Mannheimia haemolytica PHL213]EPZ23961.1 hypothetical protein L277_02830 [Mannheimia haemolytica D193]
MKYIKKLRKRWQIWRFLKNHPEVAQRRDLLAIAIKQGVENPVGRARRREP